MKNYAVPENSPMKILGVALNGSGGADLKIATIQKIINRCGRIVKPLFQVIAETKEETTKPLTPAGHQPGIVQPDEPVIYMRGGKARKKNTIIRAC